MIPTEVLVAKPGRSQMDGTQPRSDRSMITCRPTCDVRGRDPRCTLTARSGLERMTGICGDRRESRLTENLKSFGRRQAYESRGRTNPVYPPKPVIGQG